MKKLIICSLIPFSFFACNSKTEKNTQETVTNSDKLVVLWTSDDPKLAETMVFMYTDNAKKNAWFKEVTLIIWGPSAKLVSENKEIQAYLKNMIKDGVKVEACISCAQMYGIVDQLKELGCDVKGMGKPLTDYLKQDYKLLTF